MKNIIVGSANPVKLAATQAAFAAAWPEEECTYEIFDAQSGVPDQPFGSEETKMGARNRAQACIKAHPEADFYVGLEGGLEKIEGEYWAFAWMCVEDRSGKIGFGRTGAFLLPPKVSDLVERGEELGKATDIVFTAVNSKQKGGTIGILTNGKVDRTDFYVDALTFALIPFLKPELY